MSVTRESHRDRMQVLVDGQWVDIDNTVRGFEIDEANVIVDEVQQMPTSFEMSMQIDPKDAAHLFAMFDEIDRAARRERARRRGWLRMPPAPTTMSCGRSSTIRY